MAGEWKCSCGRVYKHEGCFKRHTHEPKSPDYGQKTMASLLRREDSNNSGSANAHAAALEPS